MLPDLKKVENLMPPNQSDSSSAHMVYKYGGVTYFLRAHLEWSQFPDQEEEPVSAFLQNS